MTDRHMPTIADCIADLNGTSPDRVRGYQGLNETIAKAAAIYLEHLSAENKQLVELLEDAKSALVMVNAAIDSHRNSC